MLASVRSASLAMLFVVAATGGCATDEAARVSEPLGTENAADAQTTTTDSSTATTTTDGTTAPPAKEGTFGWRVEGKGLDAPSYVFGSMHMLPAGKVWLTPVVTEALSAARVLLVEVDTSTLDPATTKASVARYAGYAPGESLAKDIGEEQAAAYYENLTSKGIPLAAVSQVRPWFVLVSSVQGLMVQTGWSGGSVDAMALAFAREKDIAVVSLETVEEQLQLLANMPMDLQVRGVGELLADPQAAIDYVTKDLYLPWSAGDDAAVAKAIDHQNEDADLLAFNLQVFETRNIRMAEKLVPHFLESGSESVVVGAGHLVGDKGLLALLRAQGFTVTQLPAP